VGVRVELTVDAQLQSLIEQAFAGAPGACVVLDPQSGATLALVSSPTFSPDAFTAPDADLVERYLEDPQAPLMNRATMGAYQPGSIVKLLTAAAGLEAGLITPFTPINCAGKLVIGDRTIHCWNRDGHGPLILRDALMQSCNVYFMQVGRRLGAAKLLDALAKAGFAHGTGWALEERDGHLPKRRLTEGEVALLAMGQGEILITPMQAAVMAAIFANGEGMVEPWVVSKVGDDAADPRKRRKLGWKPKTFESIRQGMNAVVADPLGTGHRAATPLVTIAGKTGTAQTHLQGRTHGWFVGYCPAEHPRVAMAIIAEFGGAGGDLPAEIARTVCEYISAPETL
jgi:cell division protein FtsI/penicillin-binding protein 2